MVLSANLLGDWLRVKLDPAAAAALRRPVHGVPARPTAAARAREPLDPLRLGAGHPGGARGRRRVADASTPARRWASSAKSGSGKSTLALTILRMLPPAARIVSGQMLFEGEDLVQKSDAEMRHIRGKRIAMILQDPMASLNPLFTIGDQVAEPIRVHEGAPRASAWQPRARAAESGAHPLAGDAGDAVPARDVGRHAPAHRRRDRHLVRAAPADRRRADHQPRPDDPGAIPEPAARAAARARPGADLHHPQSRHRRQDVRPARGDVCRPRRRVRAGVADLQRAGASLYPGAAELDPAHERRAASG